MKNTAHRPAGSGRSRLKASRGRLAIWRRRVREMTACMLVAATAAGHSGTALAQMGQMGMAPAGGVVNRAAAGFANLNNNGPGWLYYGLNAADRGLGYQGSYMTLGGFIPYAEDDLGGFWSADLRSHLSNYGGFFSNVGIVRKQFLGGTIGGIGVYWDYDGDQNQYGDTWINDASGSYVFAGGMTYNQVGVSAEWLTDYGNLRSNGYIPVGTTASTMGPYVGNSLLGVLGVNAGLAGADLEVGAYVPGLSDWAGMVSVGGYSFGNARYNLPSGADVVPYFGGVYTRLDMTFLNNWDFSLQANNDSYFDWTGFARLTYRMGGSRRRTVSDQLEQPMMRNEHIVRAHQAPVQALNPFTNTPWNVIHVDSAAAPGTAAVPAAIPSVSAMAATGLGTAESPVATLADAQLLATKEYDIILVHQGISSNQPYAGGFRFSADHQFLVGQGSAMRLPTANMGLVPVWSGVKSTDYPVIASGASPAITLRDGAVVDHLQITGSRVGITDSDIINPASFVIVNDVRIVGSGPQQTGVLINDANGSNSTLNFSNMSLSGLTADGFVIDGGNAGAGDPKVNIDSSTFTNTGGSAVVVKDVYNEGRVRVTNSKIDGTTAAGVQVTNGQAYIANTDFQRVGTAGVDATAGIAPGVFGNESTVQVVDSTFTLVPVGVRAQATESGVMNVTINGNKIVTTGGNGIIMSVADAPNAVVNASVVGNRVSGAATIVSGTVASTNGNILLDSVGWTWDATNGVVIPGQGILNIRAANEANLQGLNYSTSVQDMPADVIDGDGNILIPPPPFYDPALFVPLPPN
jgi:hypothetical protein